jgi:hypothetical protein
MKGAIVGSGQLGQALARRVGAARHSCRHGDALNPGQGHTEGINPGRPPHRFCADALAEPNGAYGAAMGRSRSALTIQARERSPALLNLAGTPENALDLCLGEHLYPTGKPVWSDDAPGEDGNA